jgi:hypothetical protein
MRALSEESYGNQIDSQGIGGQPISQGAEGGDYYRGISVSNPRSPHYFQRPMESTLSKSPIGYHTSLNQESYANGPLVRDNIGQIWYETRENDSFYHPTRVNNLNPSSARIIGQRQPQYIPLKSTPQLSQPINKSEDRAGPVFIPIGDQSVQQTIRNQPLINSRVPYSPYGDQYHGPQYESSSGYRRYESYTDSAISNPIFIQGQVMKIL